MSCANNCFSSEQVVRDHLAGPRFEFMSQGEVFIPIPCQMPMSLGDGQTIERCDGWVYVSLPKSVTTR